MSESLLELATTDVLLDALANGDLADLRTGDPVLDALAGWVAEIDSHPVPVVASQEQTDAEHPGTGRGWRIAATAVAMTAMSSGGIAAAATGDPLAPFNYVATALGHLAPSDRADQIRFGMPVLDSGRSGGDRQSGSDATRALDQFWPQSAEGRHRSDRPGGYEPRHRADETAQDGSTEQVGDAYTPQHVAADAPAAGTGEAPVTEIPTETPPVETPPVETPPTEPTDPQPPASDPETTPDPDPGSGSSAPPADNTSSDTGSSGGQEQATYDTGGGVVADTAQARVDDATAPAPDATTDGG